MHDILSIDDLDDLTDRELKSVISGLQVRAQLVKQLKAQGSRTGLTLEEYNEQVAGREPMDCPKCAGEGVLLPPKPREVGVIHPSSSYKCVLRLYYDVTGEIAPKEYIKPELQLTFLIGHAVHDYIQAALTRIFGEDFEAEVPIDMAGLVRGHCDGVIYVTLKTGRVVKVILEIKTAGPSTYDKLTKPLEEHRIQANALYATALDGPFVVYLYVSKTWPHPIKEYVEVYDPSLFRIWWKKKGEKVEKALENREAGAKFPEPVADAKPSECGDCPYEHSCPGSLAKKRSPFRRQRKK